MARNGRISWRLRAVALVLMISAGGLLSRLAYLQVLRHPEYAAEAQGEHIGTQTLPAHRGAILDRNGFPLATSVDTWDIAVDCGVWADERVAFAGAAALAPLLGRVPGELFSATGSASGPTVTLARQVEHSAGRAVIAAGIPGVLVGQSSRRIYPEGDLAAPLLGFTGRDQHGLTGLEADLDAALTGRPGTRWFERDSLGNRIAFGYRRQQEPVAGHDVVLTIDRAIQRMAERELDEAIGRSGATGGAIVVQDPATGALLAMANRPAFRRETLDLNDARELAMVRNRIVTDQYEPGSVFKLVTMAAAINEGKVTPGTTYNDTGSVVVGERVFRNWDYSANGTTNMTKVLVKSLNTGTVWLADKILGAEILYRYVREFGFGARSGVDLSGEAAGLYRLPVDDAWYRADLASNSFGQGVSVTPLQVINMVSTIANGGTLMRPYVQSEVRDPSGPQRTEPAAIRRVLSDAAARTLTEMMRATVEENALAHVPGYSAAGKSGTAYVPVDATDTRGDAYAKEVTIPSYVGFAPATRPRIAILVKLDNLSSSDFGGILTAPVFARLTRDILTYLRVPPDQPDTLVKDGR